MDEGNSSKKIMQYAEGDLLKKSVMRCDYGEIFQTSEFVTRLGNNSYC